MPAAASTPSQKKLTRRKKIVFSLIVAGIAAVLAFGVAEVFLRVVPIPGAVFHNFYYDDLTGGRFYPHSTMVYRNDRQEFAKRKVNSWGYLDKEHEIEKKPGTTRLGFFGDSYVEARQFPLEYIFHQVIEKKLNDSGAGPVECIAIGATGYSTFQCYLESRRWMDKVDLDRVFYVFCENDLGDNIPLIKRTDQIAYPVLSGDTLLEDLSFRDRYDYKKGRLHRTWQFLKSRSLVCGALQSRVILLRRQGIKLRAEEADKKMAGVAKTGAIPTTIDVPSSWPDSLRVQAMETAGRVLLKWRREVEAQGRDFAVVYVPREPEILKPIESQDSWAPWLFDFCARQGITIIDPTAEFAAAIRDGKELYYDHFTKDGHRIMADVFVDFYNNKWGAKR